MLTTLIERTGFKVAYQAAQSKASSTTGGLAAVPSTISHIALETVHERPVQAELIALLLLHSSDERFTSCVLVVHGMGGTGKTVTAVAGDHGSFVVPSGAHSLFFFFQLCRIRRSERIIRNCVG